VKKILSFAVFVCGVFLSFAALSAQEIYELWPGTAPGETVREAEVGKRHADGLYRISRVTVPTLRLYRPAEKSTDALMLIFPGGGYHGLAAEHEGTQVAAYLNSKGVTAAVVHYRVPRRQGHEKHWAAWMDAQRAVRLARANAKKFGIDPEKIGCMGFSAGGHLTLMTSTTSQTPAYEPVDELDAVPCHVNFAAPIYPAYVLEDGKDGANRQKGHASPMVADFAFDAKTPPMCFIHGDSDGISAMGSAAVYHKLRTMNIPAEMHIYAKVGHGFGMKPSGDHVGAWMDRVYAWMKVMGF